MRSQEPLPLVAPKLTDGAVLLDPVVELDVPDLLNAHGDPAITTWMAGWWQAPASIEAATDRVREWNHTEGAVAWAIRAADEQRLLGVINLFNRDDDGIEVGYWMAPWGRGRGAATRSLRLTGSFGLHLGCPRIRLHHSVMNPQSCAVAGRAGFALTEHLHDSWLYPDGHTHDEHLHTLVAAEEPPGGQAW